VPMAATGVSGQSSDLFRRVSMLLQNPVSVERDCPRRWSLLAASGLLGLAVVLSGISLTAHPAQAQEKEVIIRRTQVEPVKEVVAQGGAIKITIYIEGGDKKEPLIRKDEKVKVFVVPDGEKGMKENIFYVTPRVIIEEKGDGKDPKVSGQIRFRTGADTAPGKEAPKEPVRKTKVIVGGQEGNAIYAPVPKGKEAAQNLYGVMKVPQDFYILNNLQVQAPERKDGTAVWFYQKADPNLDKLRKALEKLEKTPNVDAEQIRREVLKALEQLKKIQPKVEGQYRYELRSVPLGDWLVEKKQVERKQTEKKTGDVLQWETSQMKPADVLKWETRVNPKINVNTLDALKVVPFESNNLREIRRWVVDTKGDKPSAPQGRLGIQIDLPGDILADQLSLPKGQGLVIQQVFPKSAAEKAGLKVGDVLLQLNRDPIAADLERFPKVIQELPAGTAIELVIIRKGQRQVIRNVRLASAAPERSGDAAKIEVDATKAVNAVSKVREASQDAAKIRVEATKTEEAVSKGLKYLAGQAKTKSEETATARALAAWIDAKQPAQKDGILTTTLRKGNRFTTRHEEGSLIITVVGNVNNAKGLEITVQDGTVSNRYDSVNQVPAAYRDKVSHLIDISSKGSAQINR
jgi:PDZ domain-containing protein